MIQIIEEEIEENKKDILIELQNLSNEINIKELEKILQNSITKLSNFNKRELIQSNKAIPIEKGKNQELGRMWNSRLTRATWILGLGIGECTDSFIQFYPSRSTICYK
jgi:hypothetical protein